MYAAFLRGITPMNAKMSEIRQCFEAAGFTEVKTLLASGNVVFCSTASAASLERKIEVALEKHVGRSFLTFVRPIDDLRRLIVSDPHGKFRLSASAKRVVTLLRTKPRAKLVLPGEVDGARILCVRGLEVFSAYLPGPHGPVFMRLIEKTFGESVTTRTWDTIKKVAGQSSLAERRR